MHPLITAISLFQFNYIQKFYGDKGICEPMNHAITGSDTGGNKDRL